MQYRQGDILLTTAPADIAMPDAQMERLILARGDATGHSHILLGPVRFRPDDGRGRPVVAIERPTTLAHLDAAGRHAEHAPLTILPGVYIVRHQHEYVEPGPGESVYRRRVFD